MLKPLNRVVMATTEVSFAGINQKKNTLRLATAIETTANNRHSIMSPFTMQPKTQIKKTKIPKIKKKTKRFPGSLMKGANPRTAIWRGGEKEK